MDCYSRREYLIKEMFPEGMPKLWCPLLTHYDDKNAFDENRMYRHIQSILSNVKTFLIPGSTGDGWDMTNIERKRILESIISFSNKLELKILVGILETEKGAARKNIIDTLDWLKGITCTNETVECLKKSKVCGFTICPPQGSELSQQEIEEQLASVLELNLPTALYQLPQITQNEVSPDTVRSLASEYPNLFLFKDTSGNDKVALSGFNFSGLYLVRGAEGDYGKWLKNNGGVYDGFLLSSANCLSGVLTEVIKSSGGNGGRESKLSTELTELTSAVFDTCSILPHGNVFTNANKAIDHFMAYGKDAYEKKPPMLYSGNRIPVDIIRTVGTIIEIHGLMPNKGYMY